MVKKILTWQEVVNFVTKNLTCLKQKDIASLITYARNSGFGKRVTYQKTEYLLNELDTLRKIIIWWNYLNTVSLSEWRDKNTTINIQKYIIDAFKSGEPIYIYSVFCPSYKKGIGVYGYTGKTGNYTKKMIEQLCEFVNKSKEMGLNIKAVAYFSDLILESLDKLKGSNYKQDLDKNYKDFQKLFYKQSNGLIETKKLSEENDLNHVLGEKGIISGEIKLPRDIYSLVLRRNTSFYQNILGWKKQQIQKRTLILARSYEYMGKVFRVNFPKGIMFFAESAYERGRMYSGVNQENQISIIYPKK